MNIGTEIDRYGGWIDEVGDFQDKGTFVSPRGISFKKRALPKDMIDKPYSAYKVIKPIDVVKKGKIIPWFGEIGLGIQYELPVNINELLKNGYIKKIK